MFEFWANIFPACRKPYEHAAQPLRDDFIRHGLAAGSYDDMAAWLGHGEL